MSKYYHKNCSQTSQKEEAREETHMEKVWSYHTIGWVKPQASGSGSSSEFGGLTHHYAKLSEIGGFLVVDWSQIVAN